MVLGTAMTHHPHVHCIVPGGGISTDKQQWRACKKGFFLPVKVLSRLFRRLFVTGLRQRFAEWRLQFHAVTPLKNILIHFAIKKPHKTLMRGKKR